jgi:hypothetical protein
MSCHSDPAARDDALAAQAFGPLSARPRAPIPLSDHPLPAQPLSAQPRAPIRLSDHIPLPDHHKVGARSHSLPFMTKCAKPLRHLV